MQTSEPGQPVQSSVIQPTSTDLPLIMETSTMTSAEESTTISNTPTLAVEPGKVYSYMLWYVVM